MGGEQIGPRTPSRPIARLQDKRRAARKAAGRLAVYARQPSDGSGLAAAAGATLDIMPDCASGSASDSCRRESPASIAFAPPDGDPIRWATSSNGKRCKFRSRITSR